MRTIDLALKDVRQVLRDRRSLLFLLAMPIVFTFFFGFVFGSSSTETDSRLKIGVINNDPEGILSTTLLDMISASEVVRPVQDEETTIEKLDEMVLNGELAAALIIPQGFSDSTLEGGSPKLEIISDEETSSGQTVRRALQTTISRLMGIAQTARLSADALTNQGAAADDAARQAVMQGAITNAAVAWKNQPLSVRLTAPDTAGEQFGGNVYNQFSPGMIVMFAIFGLTQAAMVIVLERQNGAMHRLLTTPMRKPELIGGHILGSFIIFFGQQLLLVLFGQIALGVNYLREPLAILLMIASLALWNASLGLLIAALVKKEDQVIIWTMLAMFILAALGGCWFSLEMVGKAFYTIGHLMPSAWAIDGFQNIIMRGLDFESVLLPAAILLAYTAAFFGIAIWRFRFE